ncbi:MAG: DUF3990 domain-containing protein [Treponema sp.]|jgi:hypothetical protein|nr:DUF3990 domain-containing protein [Treponema sp.]
MILYHGGTEIIEKPVIRKSSYTRDFGNGFYCTNIRSQAEKWAVRQARIRKKSAVLNIYEFNTGGLQSLNSRIFEDYAVEWLELVINCRKNSEHIHGFDIVYGKIANDDVGETVQAVINGLMPMDFALQKLIFMSANNQYCFCTEKSLTFLMFKESLKLV